MDNDVRYRHMLLTVRVPGHKRHTHATSTDNSLEKVGLGSVENGVIRAAARPWRSQLEFREAFGDTLIDEPRTACCMPTCGYIKPSVCDAHAADLDESRRIERAVEQCCDTTAVPSLR